jgi:hypothetical protein
MSRQRRACLAGFRMACASAVAGIVIRTPRSVARATSAISPPASRVMPLTPPFLFWRSSSVRVEAVGQVVPPARCSFLMLHEAGNAPCRSGCDPCADFLKLMVRKSDGDLRGGHTTNHTTQEAPIESGLDGNPALLDVAADGAGGAGPNARDRLQRACGPSLLGKPTQTPRTNATAKSLLGLSSARTAFYNVLHKAPRQSRLHGQHLQKPFRPSQKLACFLNPHSGGLLCFPRFEQHSEAVE